MECLDSRFSRVKIRSIVLRKVWKICKGWFKWGNGRGLKLMQKEEELKKSFNTIQNLKGTIGELEIGIDTYHGYV